MTGRNDNQINYLLTEFRNYIWLVFLLILWKRYVCKKRYSDRFQSALYIDGRWNRAQGYDYRLHPVTPISAWNQRFQLVRKKTGSRSLDWVRSEKPIGLPPYIDRRMLNSSIFFTFDLLNSHIASPELFSLLLFNEPSTSLRLSDLFRLPTHGDLNLWKHSSGSGFWLLEQLKRFGTWFGYFCQRHWGSKSGSVWIPAYTLDKLW